MPIQQPLLDQLAAYWFLRKVNQVFHTTGLAHVLKKCYQDLILAKEKLDSTSSLRNGYVGSFTTLAQPCPPYQETEKKNRAVSMAETSPVLHHGQEQRKTEKSESTLIATKDTDVKIKDEVALKKDRSLSATSSESGGGCGGAGKKGYRRFGEVNKEEKKKMTARQWLLLTVLSLATLTSSFAICLFPPFFPKIVSSSNIILELLITYFLYWL